MGKGSLYFVKQRKKNIKIRGERDENEKKERKVTKEKIIKRMEREGGKKKKY